MKSVISRISLWCSYPKKTSSAPSPDNKTLTCSLATWYNLNNGSVCGWLIGSSKNFMDFGQISIKSVTENGMEWCSKLNFFAVWAASSDSSYLLSRNFIENDLMLFPLILLICHARIEESIPPLNWIPTGASEIKCLFTDSEIIFSSFW